MTIAKYSLGFLITKVGRMATKMYADRLEAMGLTPLQAGILATLASSDRSQKQLIAALQVDKGTIHQMLKSLGQKKLITTKPDAEDKRLLRIQITKSGRKLLPEIARIDELVSNELKATVPPNLRKPLELALLEAFKAKAD